MSMAYPHLHQLIDAYFNQDMDLLMDMPYDTWLSEIMAEHSRPTLQALLQEIQQFSAEHQEQPDADFVTIFNPEVEIDDAPGFLQELRGAIEDQLERS